MCSGNRVKAASLTKSTDFTAVQVLPEEENRKHNRVLQMEQKNIADTVCLEDDSLLEQTTKGFLDQKPQTHIL